MDYTGDFFDFEGLSYLNCAGQGPFPRQVVAAIDQAVALKTRPDRIRDDVYFRVPNEIRQELSVLFGGEPSEYAVTNGASDGIFAVARGLDWQRGDEVLVAEGDFPANYFPWSNLADHGVNVHVLSQEGQPVRSAQFLNALGRHTRVVCVSLVNYNTGYRIDLEKLGLACRDNGTLLVADVSQAAGAIAFRLGSAPGALPVDVATSCGYKWLLSPYGTGFAWFRPEVLARLRVTDIYWQAVEGAENFNRLPREGWKLAAGARRFDSSETASFLNCYAMRAALHFLRRVGIDYIERHATNLIDRLIEHLPENLRVESPLERGERSTVLAIAAPEPALTRRLYDGLRSSGIIVSLRENRIRISPNVYNSESDIERCLDALKKF